MATVSRGLLSCGVLCLLLGTAASFSAPAATKRSSGPVVLSLRGGAKLNKLEIAKQSAIGVFTGAPLNVCVGGGGINFLLYSIVVYFSALFSTASCLLIVPAYWMMPFLVSLSIAVPVATKEQLGKIIDSPSAVLRRCRELTAGKKAEIVLTLILCTAVIFPCSYALLLPPAMLLRLLTNNERIVGFIAWGLSTYVGLAFSYANFVVYDALVATEKAAKEEKMGKKKPILGRA